MDATRPISPWIRVTSQRFTLNLRGESRRRERKFEVFERTRKIKGEREGPLANDRYVFGERTTP